MDRNDDVTPPESSGERPTRNPCPLCGYADNAADAARCAGCRRFLPGNTAAAGHYFLPGNTESMTHGGRRSLDRPEALAAIAGKRSDLIQHLGGEPSLIQADLITDYARTDTLIESVVANIEVGGIFTPKGRTRAAVSLLLSLMDRRLRLATTLGIERKAKPVASLVEVLNGK